MTGEPMARSFAEMKALVTGATGFLGRALVPHLLSKGARVRCLARSPKGIKELRQWVTEEQQTRLEVIEGRLDQARVCKLAAEGCNTVFHLAAEMRGAPAALVSANVTGTRNLLKACDRATVGAFVLVSSIAVYGVKHLKRGDCLDETCPLDPAPERRDPYTFSKILQERAAWAAHAAGELPLVVARPGVIYGPGRTCLTGRMGLQIGGAFFLMDGRQQLPYVHVEDCAAAIALAGIAPHAVGEAFNLVDDSAWSAAELLSEYRKRVKKIRTFRIPGWAVQPVSRLVQFYSIRSRGQLPPVLTPYKSDAMWKGLNFCNAKAKSQLGWIPAVDFETGIEQTFESLLKPREAAISR